MKSDRGQIQWLKQGKRRRCIGMLITRDTDTFWRQVRFVRKMAAILDHKYGDPRPLHDVARSS